MFFDAGNAVFDGYTSSVPAYAGPPSPQGEGLIAFLHSPGDLTLCVGFRCGLSFII